MVIKLSDLLKIDEHHIDGYLCSNRLLWDDSSNLINDLPLNFRLIKGEFSASGIFTKLQLKKAIDKIYDSNPMLQRIHIMDIRKEYNGFVQYNEHNAIPISFRAEQNAINLNIPYEQTETLEKEILNLLQQKNPLQLEIITQYTTQQGAIESILRTIQIPHNNIIMSEKQLIMDLQLEYDNLKLLSHKLPCTDHSAVSKSLIEDFSFFMQNEFNPQTDHIYMHCSGGKGRSTSVSLIFDMFIKIQTPRLLGATSFSELVAKHYAYGGLNLAAPATQEWKEHLIAERYQVLEHLYNNLILIDELKLNTVFNIPLKILLLAEDESLHNYTLHQIIENAGPKAWKMIEDDCELYHRIDNLFNELNESLE